MMVGLLVPELPVQTEPSSAWTCLLLTVLRVPAHYTIHFWYVQL